LINRTRRADTRVGGERAPVVAPLVVLVSCALLVLTQLYLAIPLAPVVGEALGGGGAAAALGTAYSLAYALGFLIFGPLSDCYGRKVVLVPGMAALAIATAGLSAASSLPLVALLRTVQGLLAASFAAVALAYVGEALPPRWRSTGIGAVATAFLVAGIVGQVYAQAVAQALGWRWVFALAAPALALAAVALATVLVEPARSAPAASLGEKYRELGAVALRRELALPYLATCTVLLSFVALYAALGPLLRSRFGLDGTEVLLVRLAERGGGPHVPRRHDRTCRGGRPVHRQRRQSVYLQQLARSLPRPRAFAEAAPTGPPPQWNSTAATPTRRPGGRCNRRRRPTPPAPWY
jgi:MFS family permease